MTGAAARDVGRASAGSGSIKLTADEHVETVHLVAKTHLDLGFTALAAEVADQYVHDFFPRAMRVAAELRERGGDERLVWTTGAWPLWHALEVAEPVLRRQLEDAVAAGDLAWHALPLTTHTELMDRRLAEAGLGISAELDARFGHRTIAAKMTDVPGHTRGLVPILAAAGVRLLHIGVNPAWPVPDVPPVFRWRSADGSEVVVVYQAGGYGGFRAVPGCADALAFAHTTDNAGPPAAADVLAEHAMLRAAVPGAAVVASTLDAFTEALLASGAVDDLPVVTAEIGDPWIFGAATDPQKVRRFRSMLRRLGRDENASVDALRSLLLVAEHTWGLDEKTWFPDLTHWSRTDLDAIRRTPEAVRFEASWVEQRRYLDAAHGALESGAWLEEPVARSRADLTAEIDRLAAIPAEAGRPIAGGRWRLVVDRATGAIAALRDREGGVLADADHPLALVRYQTFDEADYGAFYDKLVPEPRDEWWAVLDNTKPGIDAAGAVSRWWVPAPGEVLVGEDPDDGATVVLVPLTFPAAAVGRFGAPPEAWTVVRLDDRPTVGIELAWFDKPECRFPEATWWSANPPVADPTRWTMDKLGEAVSPLDVVRHGGRALHGVGSGLAYAGPDGTVHVRTLDAPLVAPGRPRLLDADPPVPDLAGGWHVLLHDNLWGTNFPMWNGGDATFRFSITRHPPTLEL